MAHGVHLPQHTGPLRTVTALHHAPVRTVAALHHEGTLHCSCRRNHVCILAVCARWGRAVFCFLVLALGPRTCFVASVLRSPSCFRGAAAQPARSCACRPRGAHTPSAPRDLRSPLPASPRPASADCPVELSPHIRPILYCTLIPLSPWLAPRGGAWRGVRHSITSDSPRPSSQRPPPSSNNQLRAVGRTPPVRSQCRHKPPFSTAPRRCHLAAASPHPSPTPGEPAHGGVRPAPPITATRFSNKMAYTPDGLWHAQAHAWWACKCAAESTPRCKLDCCPALGRHRHTTPYRPSPCQALLRR